MLDVFKIHSKDHFVLRARSHILGNCAAAYFLMKTDEHLELHTLFGRYLMGYAAMGCSPQSNGTKAKSSRHISLIQLCVVTCLFELQEQSLLVYLIPAKYGFPDTILKLFISFLLELNMF